MTSWPPVAAWPMRPGYDLCGRQALLLHRQHHHRVERAFPISAESLLTDSEKIRRLPWALAHIAANAVFAQLVFTGPVFVLFLTELGLDKAQVGLLLALFPLAGVVAPFIAPLVARVGYKRVFMSLWGMRKLVAACLILTPWVAGRVGPEGTLRFVAAVLAVFALCRAIAETALFPWLREFVPDRVRGRFVAVDSILSTLFGFAAVSLAGYVIARTPGLTGFTRLIGVGVVFGLLCVVAAAFIPGGAPIPRERTAGLAARAVFATLRDRSFGRFLAGLGLMALGVVPLTSFLPLFARERIGLAQANVILLQNALLAGGLLFGYLWGLAADRRGSKPVMLAGVAGAALLPALWLAVPGQSAWSFPLALAIAFLTGIVAPAWAIGSTRFLFIDVAPADGAERYMAAYYAWAGLTGAFGAMLAGRVLESLQSLSQMGGPALDPYGLLFAAGVVFSLASLALLAQIRSRAV